MRNALLIMRLHSNIRGRTRSVPGWKKNVFLAFFAAQRIVLLVTTSATDENAKKKPARADTRAGRRKTGAGAVSTALPPPGSTIPEIG